MDVQPSPLVRLARFVLAACALLLASIPAQAITRGLEISGGTEGAQVTINGKSMGTVPLKIAKFDFKSDESYVIQLSKDGYAPRSKTVGYENAKAVKMSESVRVAFEPLDEIRRDAVVSVTVTGADGATLTDAALSVGGRPSEKSNEVRLTFQRGSATEPWPVLTVRAERPPKYYPVERKVQADEIKPGGPPLQLALSLGEVRRETSVTIKANIEGAEVTTNGVALGTTGAAELRHTFVFNRATPGDPWPGIELRIAKEGYDYHRPGSPEPEPAYTRKISAEEKVVLANASEFKESTYLTTPVRLFDVRPGNVQALETNILSQVKPSTQDKAPIPGVGIDPERPFALSRIVVDPDSPDKYILAMPIYERRPASGQTPAGRGAIIGTQLVQRNHVQPATTPLTSERGVFDLDPCVTKDWIYYSSDRQRTRTIWRISRTTKSGFTSVTGQITRFDTEPAVSPDETKLAYVSRDPEAPATAKPWIWTADADGRLPTQRWEGRSPAWSPDGKRLAYVGPDNGLWIGDFESGETKQIVAQAEGQVETPVWKPNGKEIVFVSNESLNERGRRNHDIWVVTAEGANKRQLVTDGSLDAAPAVSPDGRYLYFFSNRGAVRPGQEKLQVYRLELE